MKRTLSLLLCALLLLGMTFVASFAEETVVYSWDSTDEYQSGHFTYTPSTGVFTAEGSGVFTYRCLYSDEAKEALKNELSDTVDLYEFYSNGAIRHAAFSGYTGIDPGNYVTFMSVETVSLPEGLKWLKGGSFAYSKVTSVTFPSTLEELGTSSFAHCAALEEININPGLIRASDHEFAHTPWLEKQKQEWVIIGDGILIQYNGTDTDIVIPDTVKRVCGVLNDSLSDVKSVTFGDSVVEIINTCSSDYCSVEKVMLGKNVRSIIGTSFKNCYKLNSMVIPESVKELNLPFIMHRDSFGDSPARSLTILGEPPKASWVFENETVQAFPPSLPPWGVDAGWRIVFGMSYLTIYANGFYKEEWETYRQQMIDRFNALCPPNEEEFGDTTGEDVITFTVEYPVTYDPATPVLRGDVNLDGKVGAADAALVLRYIVKLQALYGRQLTAGGLTVADSPMIQDAAKILRYTVKLTDTL